MNKIFNLKEFLIFNILVVFTAVTIAVTNIPIFVLMVSVLIGLYTYRNGPLYGGLFTIASGLQFLIVNVELWLTVSTVLGFSAVTLGSRLREERMHEEAIFKSAIAGVFGIFLMFFIIDRQLGPGSVAGILGDSVMTFEFPPELASEGALTSISEFEVRRLMHNLMPSFFVIMMFFLSASLYLVLVPLIRLTTNESFDRTPIKKFELPGHPIMGTTLLIVIALLLSFFMPSISTAIIVNTLCMVMFIYSIQGMTLIVYVIDGLKLPSFLTFTLVILATFLLQILGLIVIGWLDLSFGIKHRIRKRKE